MKLNITKTDAIHDIYTDFDWYASPLFCKLLLKVRPFYLNLIIMNICSENSVLGVQPNCNYYRTSFLKGHCGIPYSTK